MPEDTLHEHRCPAAHCGHYWTCRRTDCTPWDVCDECERKDWAEQHDPQPELEMEETCQS